jgi:hypothetical protein
MNMVNFAFYSTGCLLSYAYPLLLVIAESGTCSQGSTDAYAASTFLCAGVMIIFVPVMELTFRTCGKVWWLCLFHLVSLACYISIIPRYFYYTTLRGYSPCYGNVYWGGFTELPAAGYETAAAEGRLFALFFTLGIIMITFYSARIIYYRFRRRPLQ